MAAERSTRPTGVGTGSAKRKRPSSAGSGRPASSRMYSSKNPVKGGTAKASGKPKFTQKIGTAIASVGSSTKARVVTGKPATMGAPAGRTAAKSTSMPASTSTRTKIGSTMGAPAGPAGAVKTAIRPAGMATIQRKPLVR